MNSECRILCDIDSILALQFSDRELKNIKIYVYVKNSQQNSLVVYPICNSECTYSVNGQTMSIDMLDSFGIQVKVGANYTASVIEIMAIKSA